MYVRYNKNGVYFQQIQIQQQQIIQQQQQPQIQVSNAPKYSQVCCGWLSILLLLSVKLKSRMLK